MKALIPHFIVAMVSALVAGVIMGTGADAAAVGLFAFLAIVAARLALS